MIRLGLRLTFRGGREAVARLVITALATALGVGMLLSTVAGMHAVREQDDRYAWLETGAGFVHPRPVPAGTTPLLWSLSPDEFRGRIIARVDLAAMGAHSPVPPGLPRLPAAGEYYASPALVTLLKQAPRDQLAARFPGHLAGTIGAAALAAPDSLVAVVGRTPAELRAYPRAQAVRYISTTSPAECRTGCYAIGIDRNGVQLVLGVVAAALLFPLLIFVGVASRLSAARREQRFAAMRLVGATPRQIAVVSTVESTVASVLGVALGCGLFAAVRPLLARVPFTGARFFRSDLAVPAPAWPLIVLGVPVAAAIAARLGMRRVSISPLGVSRRTTPPPPRAWRLVPLVAGLGELTFFVFAGRPRTTEGQLAAYLGGVLVTMAGLVVAGPWLTLLASRLLARGTGRPAVLLAGRRLADDPRAGYRAVSGLVLALFAASISIGIMATMHGKRVVPTYGHDPAETLVLRLNTQEYPGSFTEPPGGYPPVVPASLVAQVTAVPGVRGATLVRRDVTEDARFADPFLGLARCADLPHTPALGRCPAGARTARIVVADTSEGRSGKAVVPVAISDLAGLPVTAVVLDGTRGALERARTILERAFPHFVPFSIAEEQANRPSNQLLEQFQRLADVVVFASLVVAGCSLAVTVAGGLAERKRPFSLLRLAGAPLGVLRRVVLLESGLPLLALAVVSAGVGFLAAGLFTRSQLHQTLVAPGAGYYLGVVGGLVLALALIASTLPLLVRLTGPETARNG